MAVRAGFFIVVFAALSAMLAGCTSAPIDMSAAGPVELDALDEQDVLRERADQLAMLVDEEGWSISANPAEAARNLLGRLIGGDRGDQEPVSAVETYLARHDAPFRAAVSDVEDLSQRSRDVAGLAITVASADGRLPQASLARDIAAAERALGAVRRAKAFFNAVGEAAAFGEAEREAYANALSGLREAEAALARGADALAERRWAARTGLFS